MYRKYRAMIAPMMTPVWIMFFLFFVGCLMCECVISVMNRKIAIPMYPFVVFAGTKYFDSGFSSQLSSAHEEFHASIAELRKATMKIMRSVLYFIDNL